MKKFVCVPCEQYDVVIVTNGTPAQIQLALIQLNERTGNEIPMESRISYLLSFPDLVSHVHRNSHNQQEVVEFKGKTVFMFFNGIEFVQTFLSDVIDHHNTALRSAMTLTNGPQFAVLCNTYFYFDATVAADLTKMSASAIFGATQLSYNVVGIANDVIKKLEFMVRRVRAIFIDDVFIGDEKAFDIRGLLRNHANIEEVLLASKLPLQMRGLIV